MPLRKNQNKISNVKLGSNELAKIYLGTSEVFTRDAPVWFIRSGKHWMISKDGYTFKKIEGDSYDEYWHTPCMIGGKFAIATTTHSGSYYSQSTAPIRFYDIEKLRQGTFSFTTINVVTSKHTYGVYSMASDGSQVMVVGLKSESTNYDFNGIYYSLNGGVTWTQRKTNSSGTSVLTYDQACVKYIGDNEFLITNQGRRNGYYYWKSTNPGAIYGRSYTVPDASASENSIQNMWNCNGRIYTNVYKYNKDPYNVNYYGTKTAPTGLVVISPTRKNTWLGYYTYIYGKYYAIRLDNSRAGKIGVETGGNLRYLYVSDDGITFTEIADFFPSGGNVCQMEKNNGRLEVLGTNFFGYIDENQQLHYTSFTQSSSGDTVPGFVSNKFHKF